MNNQKFPCSLKFKHFYSKHSIKKKKFCSKLSNIKMFTNLGISQRILMILIQIFLMILNVLSIEKIRYIIILRSKTIFLPLKFENLLSN